MSRRDQRQGVFTGILGVKSVCAEQINVIAVGVILLPIVTSIVHSYGPDSVCVTNVV